MKLSDAHAHLNEMISYEGYPIEEMSSIFTCSSKESDWKKTEILSKDNRITPFFGTHPWFINEYDGPEPLIEILKEYPYAGIGEIGLDATHDNMEGQIMVFEEQMDIAEDMNRITQIHSVKSEEQILKTLRKKDTLCILHSFSGPVSYVKPFTGLNCYFSISPRILSKPDTKIESILSFIPQDRILIETDAPNNRASIYELIKRLSKILRMGENEFSEMTAYNLQRISP